MGVGRIIHVLRERKPRTQRSQMVCLRLVAKSVPLSLVEDPEHEPSASSSKGLAPFMLFRLSPA